MGKSLKEYAAANPLPVIPDGEREQMTAIGKTIKERAADLEAAEQLKDSILTQLEQGTEPQIILYAALKCIGLLTNDAEYITTGTGLLDFVWEDLAQQSLLQDNAAIAARRIENMQEKYNQKLRNSINRQLFGYRRIERALMDVLTALNEIDPDPPSDPE